MDVKGASDADRAVQAVADGGSGGIAAATSAAMTGSAGATTFDSGHTDAVHDAQLDYYGRRLATCSSDASVKVFDVSSGERHVHLADLRGHEGPVWQLAWAHPKFGSLLASAGHDGHVIVWRESPGNFWEQVRSSLCAQVETEHVCHGICAPSCACMQSMHMLHVVWHAVASQECISMTLRLHLYPECTHALT